MAKNIQYGQTAAVNNSSTQKSGTNNELPQVFVARVVSIILDDTHPRYNEQQGVMGIGTIEYQQVDPPSNTSGNTNLLTAKPLFGNINNYPINEEIVICFRAPTIFSQISTSNKGVYYLPPVNVWNSIHTNALPNSLAAASTPQAGFNRSLDAIEAGAFNIINDSANFKGTSTQVGSSNFQEQQYIQPLLPFEGDVIHEGRWGNSIRFGSTFTNLTTNKAYQNSWSSEGNIGSPITIIRNGQTTTSPEFQFVTEQINTDDSSIWITSDQQLNTLNLASADYGIFPSTIINPKIYSSPQIIINSGRIILNAKSDNILFSSNKSISLNANEDLNFKASRSTTIDSSTILLGNKNATESVLLGDKTQKQLEYLCNALLTLIGPLTQLQTFVENTEGVVKTTPNSDVQIAANSAKKSITLIQSALESGIIKSKRVKTI